MFNTLFTTLPVDVGGGIVAHVLSEPTVAALRALGRAVASSGGKLTPVEDAAITTALMVDRWTGDGAPGADEWPPLGTGMAVRLDTLDCLPRAALVQLAKACSERLSLSSADQDSSGVPSE